MYTTYGIECRNTVGKRDEGVNCSVLGGSERVWTVARKSLLKLFTNVFVIHFIASVSELISRSIKGTGRTRAAAEVDVYVS